VVKVAGQGAIRRRLLDLGMHSGETVKMIKSAPLRDPLEIALNGGHLSIRRSEAALVSIEPLMDINSG
jgi:Fe2+ transport system protein FeoA